MTDLPATKPVPAQRIIHFRPDKVPTGPAGITPCGVSDVGVWTDHRIKRVTCTGCRQVQRINA